MPIHFLPQVRAETTMALSQNSGVNVGVVHVTHIPREESTDSQTHRSIHVPNLPFATARWVLMMPFRSGDRRNGQKKKILHEIPRMVEQQPSTHLVALGEIP